MYVLNNHSSKTEKVGLYLSLSLYLASVKRICLPDIEKESFIMFTIRTDFYKKCYGYFCYIKGQVLCILLFRSKLFFRRCIYLIII